MNGFWHEAAGLSRITHLLCLHSLLEMQHHAKVAHLALSGGLMTKLEMLDASLRAIAVDLGLCIDAHVAAEADPLHPTRLRLTANEVCTLRNTLPH